MPETPPFTSADRIFHVADDILGLRLPMPPPLEWVNVYFLRDGDGWAMVDTGYNTPDSRGVLEDALANQLDGLPITRLFVTHYHPDHIGQAGYICERFKCPLYMTQTDWLLARWLSTDTTPTYLKVIEQYYRNAGTPDDLLEHILSRGNSFLRTSDEVPPVYHRIREGEHITVGSRTWQVKLGIGHAPEMFTLYDADNKMLISADHIVARITPNISIWAYNPDDNPLKDYMDSMRQFAIDLPDDIILLPGHGRTFENFHDRVAGYQTHHENRLQKLLTGMKDNTARNMHDMHKIMFTRELTARDYVFALGETHSHVNYLVYEGKLRKVDSAPHTTYIINQ
jgi:glyoxylase-like metal-dependent hydrolase (beta-lactamase superfamily II)